MIGKSDLENKELTIEQVLSKTSDKRFSFSFYSDWDSLIFWKTMNWRNFTFIYLYLEFNDYKWIEFDITLLGLHFCFDWFRK